MGNKSILWKGCIAAALMCSGSSSALAQSAAESLLVEGIPQPTVITDGDFYTQIQFNIDDLRPPTDDRGGKRFGRALLNALGLDKKTRAITVTVQVIQADGLALPETPLITYYFDSSRTFTNFDVTNGYLTPRMSIPSGQPVTVIMRYRYVENTEYNPNFLTDGVESLFPNSGVVNAVSRPFVAGITGLAASVFQAAGSREVTSSQSQRMSPYSNGATGRQRLVFTLQSPGRGKFGKIEAEILAAPGLRRVPKKVAAVTLDVMQRIGSDNAATLAIDTQTGSVNLLNEVKSDPSYAAMRNAVSGETVGDFCEAARGISTKFNLTRMDRNNLIYRAMQDAGFIPGVHRADANTWLTDCFKGDPDPEYLASYRGVNFTLPTSSVQVDPTAWPRPVKYAVGCQMRRMRGPDCSQNAPNQASILTARMAETVEVGVIALSGVDQSAFPDDREVASSVLIPSLEGSIDTFACFQKGLVLVDGGTNYFLNVTYENESIVKMNILRAPVDAHLCLG